MIRSAFRSRLLAATMLAALVVAPLAPAKATTTDSVALITNTLRTASATAATSVPQTNENHRGVVCTWAANASSGSTSTTFSIQQFDLANGTWQTIKQSAAILSGSGSTDAPNTPHSVVVYPGVAVGSLATNMEAQSAVLPRTWRVSQTITAGGGTNPAPAVTGKLACGYAE